MASTPNSASSSPVGPVTKWLILILASIGFAFDIYELLMLPLIGPGALRALGISPGSDEFVLWVSLLFYVPAVFGGIFGLLGGYMTDRYGRRTVLTYSILLYAVSAFLGAYSTSPMMLLVFRCGVFVGVCVEFVAAVAWLAELFPDPKERENALAYTQAFSSIGGLLVAVAYSVCAQYKGYFPPIGLPGFLSFLGEINDPQAAWRYTLMSGLLPAIPLLVIRPFLPESPVWQHKKLAGKLKRPSFKELFSTPALRKATIVTTIMFACSYGAAFGAIQQMRNMIPGLPETKEMVKERKTEEALRKEFPEWDNFPQPKQELLIKKTGPRVAGEINSDYTKVQELGGLLGRFLLALLVIRVVSRRALIRIFQIPGLIITPLVFLFFLPIFPTDGPMRIPNEPLFYIPLEFILLHDVPVTLLNLSVAAVALCTIAQFSFWGNYLPTVYPVHLRGTGESFAANVGGRMIGTSFAAITLGISMVMPYESFPVRMAVAAAFVGGFVYLLGFITSFFLPEPKPEDMNE
ncbi:MAG: MFS transporter [Gemmataceae bacterium]